MQGVGAKLSKHVLGMKFMRKTKDQLDKDKVEKTHRQHFSAGVKSDDVNVEATTTPALKSVVDSRTAIVEEVPSYSQCLGFNFGRVSYGGFNPIVEYNVGRGIWKAVHAGANESDEEQEAEESIEKDIPDEEMARTYGSLIGTLGKHFMKKKDRDREEEQKNETTGRSRGGRSKSGLSKQKQSPDKREGSGKKRFGWKKDWKGQGKKNRSSTGQRQNEERRANQHEDSSSGPPQKKRKFWKPDD